MTAIDGWTLAVAIGAALISVWALLQAKLAPRRERQQALRDQLRGPLETTRDHLLAAGEFLRSGRPPQLSRDLLTESADQISRLVPRMKTQPQDRYSTAAVARTLEAVADASRHYDFYVSELPGHRAGLEAERQSGMDTEAIVAKQARIDDLVSSRDAARNTLLGLIKGAQEKAESEIARLDKADRR